MPDLPFTLPPIHVTFTNPSLGSDASRSVGRPEAPRSNGADDLRAILADIYKKTMAAGYEQKIPELEEMATTHLKRDENDPKRATVTYTDKAGQGQHFVIESSLQTMGNIATKAGQYEALIKHGAQRLEKNREDRPATRIIPRSNPSRIYHMHYGLSKETNELGPARGKLGEGGFGRIRHAYMEDHDKKTAFNVAAKKYKPDSFKNDPYECIQLAEREVSMYRDMGESEYLPEVFDVVHIEKDGRIKSTMFLSLMEGDALEQVVPRIDSLPMEEARGTTRELARTITKIVAFLEDKGVIHMNFELKNLFRENSEKIKVLDFGMARKIEHVGPGFRNLDRNNLARILGFDLAMALEDHTRGNDMEDDIESLRAMSRALLNREIIPKVLLENDYFKE